MVKPQMFGLLYNCIVYTFAAAGEYWILDFMNSLFGIRLPIFSAMLQNSSWPIQAYLYTIQRKEYETNVGPRVITKSMYQSYCVLGGLNTIISITRTFGLTTLPPTLYVIIANTEIVFEAIMSATVLGRKPGHLQLTAVSFVIMGVLISLYDPINEKYGSSPTVSQQTLLTGIFMSLLSRFTSALNTVLADRFLGKERKTRMGILECSFFNAIIPFFSLPLLLSVLPEYSRWGILMGHPPRQEAAVTFLCIALAASKHMDRLSKFYIVSRSSTMFFAVIDSNMKIMAGIGTFLFFNEVIYWTDVVGFLCIFVALIVSSYEKLQANKEEAAAKAKHDIEKSIEGGDNAEGSDKTDTEDMDFDHSFKTDLSDGSLKCTTFKIEMSSMKAHDEKLDEVVSSMHLSTQKE